MASATRTVARYRIPRSHCLCGLSTRNKKTFYVIREWMVEGMHSARKTRECNSSTSIRSALDVQINTSSELKAPRAGRSCTMSATVAGKCIRHRATSVRLFKLSGVIYGSTSVGHYQLQHPVRTATEMGRACRTAYRIPVREPESMTPLRGRRR